MNEELCMCMAEVARKHKPVRFEWNGPLLWAIWDECEEHHERFVSPSWHPRLGQLDKMTATAEKTVAAGEVLSR